MPPLNLPPRTRLTIFQLQALARVASNNCWVRWWAHWNHPANPAQMAISLMGEEGRTMECRDLEQRGFEKSVNSRGFVIYVGDRVEEDGTPYISRL